MVIFRKVTNGFRSEWGAQTYAAFRFVVSTANSTTVRCSRNCTACSPYRQPTKWRPNGESNHLGSAAAALAKDFENLAETPVAFVTLAFIRLAVWRLART